jgi:hypothetical protein
MRKSLWAIALSAVMLASGTVATAEVRPAAVPGEVIGTVHFGKRSAKLSAESKQLLAALVELNPDAISFDVAGYVQRTKSKRNDRRLSLARASKVRNYMRDDLGVTVPITISGNRVPAKNGDKWFARRATVRAVQPPEDTTPELQDEIAVAWGPTNMVNASFGITSLGTWSYPPDSYEYKWQYSLNASDWLDLVDGPVEIYANGDRSYLVSYDVSGATTASVTMVGTGNQNVMKTCVYVKAQVVAISGGFRSELTDSLDLEPVVQCSWPE